MDSLQLGMAEALDEDQKRQQINDAKLRAVAQRVDYDEFCKMVSGAHLRPVKPCSKESAAISKPFEGFVMPKYQEKPAGCSPGSTAAASAQSFTAPESANDFTRTWRRRCKTTELRLQYLRVIEPESLPLIFRVEMDPMVLDGIVEALHVGLSAEDTTRVEAEWVSRFLYNISRVNCFGMTLDIADKGEPPPEECPLPLTTVDACPPLSALKL